MIFGLFLLQAICVTCCLGSSHLEFLSPSSPEEGRSQHMTLQEQMLNSILGRLRSQRKPLTESVASDDINCRDLHNIEVLPEYTDSINPVMMERNVNEFMPPKYHPICKVERSIRGLNTEEYEYRPAYYEEVKCVPRTGDKDVMEALIRGEVCSSLGFTCVQWNKTIHLTRRRYTSDCWESKTMVVPAGCECMWPIHRLGDMDLHT